MLNPRVASASFVDETMWIPRGVPSVAEFVEVPGGLSAYAFSYEPELVVSADVAARGLALHGPSKLSFAADSGLRLGQTESMPATCAKHSLAELVQAPAMAPTTAAPSTTPAPTHLPTSSPTASPSAEACADSAFLKPHLARQLRGFGGVASARRAVRERVRGNLGRALGARVRLRARAADLPRRPPRRSASPCTALRSWRSRRARACDWDRRRKCRPSALGSPPTASKNPRCLLRLAPPDGDTRPTEAPTYGTLSPTEATFPGVCDESSSTLKLSRSAPSTTLTCGLRAACRRPTVTAEVPGALSAHAYGHEPELMVSSAAASARGLVLLGPKLAFAAGAGLYLETDSMPKLCFA